MKRQKTKPHMGKPRLASPVPRNSSRSRQPVLVFGICKPGLIIVMVAYVLLAVAALIAVIWPHAVVSKTTALVAYLLLSGLFVYKGYRVWRGKGTRGRSAE